VPREVGISRRYAFSSMAMVQEQLLSQAVKEWPSTRGLCERSYSWDAHSPNPSLRIPTFLEKQTLSFRDEQRHTCPSFLLPGILHMTGSSVEWPGIRPGPLFGPFDFQSLPARQLAGYPGPRVSPVLKRLLRLKQPIHVGRILLPFHSASQFRLSCSASGNRPASSCGYTEPWYRR